MSKKFYQNKGLLRKKISGRKKMASHLGFGECKMIVGRKNVHSEIKIRRGIVITIAIIIFAIGVLFVLI